MATSARDTVGYERTGPRKPRLLIPFQADVGMKELVGV